MSKNQNVTSTATNSWIRRATAGLVLAAAPALIAFGAAGAGHADATVDNHGPSMHAPAQHRPFPNQHNQPQPGTSIHHHHQNNRHNR
jgi:hypothetical protein